MTLHHSVFFRGETESPDQASLARVLYEVSTISYFLSSSTSFVLFP
uniref:Uncharacterized protein n=1 Tax=Rhizophora mucronata TaxID=61149 RepID=A0A2P2QQC8_RHIMU